MTCNFDYLLGNYLSMFEHVELLPKLYALTRLGYYSQPKSFKQLLKVSPGSGVHNFKTIIIGILTKYSTHSAKL